MAAPTEPAGGGRVECPVCSEPFSGRPARCFRCETPLEAWWTFEEALALLPARPAAAAPRRSRLLLLAALVAVIATNVAWWTIAARHAPPEAAGPAAVPTPAAAVAAPPPAAPPAPAIRYRVQPGDSLWRIAASLTGEGHRWRELWPELAGRPDRLRPGTVLELDPRRLEKTP